jgi:AraC family transcriptional regulator
MLAENTSTLLENNYVTTRELHQVAVERVIQTMHERLCDPLSLDDMADIACLSPYYFSRVFHQIVGVPPCEFLATLRIERAKHLLLTTSLSVTAICFEVGYVGLGSFTTRFTQQVGLAPRRLRTLVRNVVTPASLPHNKPRKSPTFFAQTEDVRGCILTTEPFHGLIFAGLFPSPIPQGRPVRCIHLQTPGPYAISNVPDGRYFLLVAALPISEKLRTYLLPQDNILVGTTGPILVKHGMAQQEFTVVLHTPCLTDPPLISALPFI